jgi:hypothetical protein
MIILPDYEMNPNCTTIYIRGDGSFGGGFGDGYGYGFTPDHGYGDGLGYGDGNGDSDIAFKVMHRKYPHNLIIL